MATLIRPPPSISMKTRQDRQPFFTLHKGTNDIMAWETEKSKMAVVAFSRRVDIHTMGSMIEYHHEYMQEWPDFRKMTFTSGPNKKPLDILTVYEWKNIDELKVFCAQYYFDLILVDKINDSFSIAGSVYSLSIPIETYVPYLENLYT